MSKKINRKLDASENPIYTEETHSHLATCDFRAGMIYHYFDGKKEESQKLLNVYKIKKSEQDQDLSMIAKKQFKKEWFATEWAIDNSDYDVLLDIKRGTNAKTNASEFKKKLEGMVEAGFGLVKGAKVEYIGQRSFGYIFMAIGLLCVTNNEAMDWLERSVDEDFNDGFKALEWVVNDLKNDCFVMGGDGYIVDYEGYMHPYDADGVNMDFESSIRLEEKMLGQVIYGLSKENADMLVRWLTEHNIIDK
jgi:hypothetical protein